MRRVETTLLCALLLGCGDNLAPKEDVAPDEDADGFSVEAGDCNDHDGAISPRAQEICDIQGVDEDCDGLRDDADPSVNDASKRLFYEDADGDGFGNASQSQTACRAPLGYVANAGDCADDDELIHPAADERCDPGAVDEDCDGAAEDDDASVLAASKTWFHRDGDGDGFGDPEERVAACDAPLGFVADARDCNDQDAGISPAALERCDAADLDEDCDGAADDADASVNDASRRDFFADFDGDGFGAASIVLRACDDALGRVANAADCDDERAEINPNAVEVCDSDDVDENCNGAADDEDVAVDKAGAVSVYRDGDGDGYGDAVSLQNLCDPPLGFVADETDCDDGNASVHPSASERCDRDDVDEDCDGAADNDDPDGAIGMVPVYVDHDGDGYGAEGSAAVALKCEAEDEQATNNDDCDDALAHVHPEARESAGDDTDEDCDGTVLCYIDADDDGARLSTTRVSSDGDCADPQEGRLTDLIDCDDANARVYPGAAELCDGVRNDCQNLVWQADTQLVTYFPGDGGAPLDVSAEWPDATALVVGTPRLPKDGELVLCPGSYGVNALGEEVHARLRSLAKGRPGAAETILDGRGSGSILSVGSASDLVIEGLTLRDGLAEEGGAIHVLDGSVAVYDSVFLHNSATVYGGAITVRGDNPTLLLEGCELGGTDGEGNSAGEAGGAIAFFANTAAGLVQVSDTTLRYNSADRAGAVYYSGGDTVVLLRTSLVGNSATTAAGALAVVGTAPASIVFIDTSFEANIAGASGGAVVVANASVHSSCPELASAGFRNNGALEGGAVSLADAALFTNGPNAAWGLDGACYFGGEVDDNVPEDVYTSGGVGYYSGNVAFTCKSYAGCSDL